MPENVERFGVFFGNDAELATGPQRGHEVLHDAIHLDGDSGAKKSLTDGSDDLGWKRPFWDGSYGAVWKR